MPSLQRLDDSHAAALLTFERDNRDYFARFVPDRGDEVGFRVAAREAGRGLAQAGVHSLCARARDEYGLRTLIAHAAPANHASLAVLRGTGFTPIGEIELDGLPCVRHAHDLTTTGRPGSTPGA